MTISQYRPDAADEPPPAPAQSQPSELLLLAWALWKPTLLAIVCVLFVLALIFDRESLAALPL